MGDTNYRPPTYTQRLALFNSYPNSTKDVIFLGNSITAGTDWNELLQLPAARNRGISGDLTFGVLQRLDEVTEGHPAKIFILIGINDIGRNIPDSLISRVNDGIRRLTEKYHITLVDLHPHSLDKDGRLNADYTMDGLHLNDKGYQVWRTVLQPYL